MNNGRSVIFNKMDSYGKSISNKVSSFNRKHSVKRWPQFGTDSHIDKKKFLRMGLLTISFYILTNSFQRLAGTFSIHGGQPFLAASSFGIISTTLSCLISREIQEYVLPVGFYKSKLNPFYEKQNSDDVTRRACLGVGVFSLLEKKMFRTALPSSLLSVGVHATNARRLPATGIVATEKQRNLIQILGKQLGCHQCGSKQFFSENKQFIADHMPPTKFASEMNENFWRKTTNMEVQQYLLPQCQKCWKMQGNAVRFNRAVLVHHHNLRLYHFAPAIAYYLSENKAVRQWIDRVSSDIKKQRSRISNRRPLITIS